MILLSLLASACLLRAQERPRARDLGIQVGVLQPGPLNAITDVAGVRVGHTTLIKGDSIRTGVTAILPHGGNLFQEKVPGAVFVGNAFGKLMGSTQVNELGEIETPILLTSTLATPRVADALISYMLAQPGNENVQSVNPLVGETNDGFLNDIRSRPITQDDVFAAIQSAKEGPLEEGVVGAGTGTVAFGFKGGIGTSSRRLPASLGGYTVGVLVQTNFGGILTIAGAPVGRELGQYYLKNELPGGKPSAALERLQNPNGSIMMVVATDAPIDHRNLNRLAARAMMGLGRTGSSGSNGSGDFVIAFSTAPDLRIRPGQRAQTRTVLDNESMSPLFEAVIEATEEAIYNSLFRAHDVTGRGHTVKALPVEETREILRRYGAIGRTALPSGNADPMVVLQNIAHQIEELKQQFPQLAAFSPQHSISAETASLSYSFHTHRYSGRGGGWTRQVPNPDADGLWFYIDVHNPRSTAQIDTQPVAAALCLGQNRVQYLILEGSRTQPLAGAIQNVLQNNGVRPCASF